MRVILAAGGTAGHINPALAIADKIMKIFPKSEILFVGTPNGMEASLVKKSGYRFYGIEMAGFQRKLSMNNIKRNFKAVGYYLSAKSKVQKIIEDFKPDIVVGTGGYVSAPVLSTAAKMGIKTATHESNSLPGVTTKMLSKKVDKVFVGTKDTISHLETPEKCVVTGNPLRSNIKIEQRESARKRLGLPDGMTILSFGGSLGANKITEAVIALIGWENQKGDINHIHAYGGNGREVFEKMLTESGVTPDKKRVIFREYIDNMYTCMCAADLIISRAGAMTLTELTEIGRASILIPFPQAAENHQYYNALTMAKNHAAILIEDKDLTKDSLIGIISEFYDDNERLRIMEENASQQKVGNAADLILGEIIELISKEKC